MNSLNKEITSIFDELPLWSAPFGLKLLEEVQLKKNIKVLDIGFGTGFPLLELAQRLGESSVVYGIDPWSEAVERTQQKIKSMNLKNVRIFEGHAEHMPFRDGYFDLIISNNGLNNTNDISKVLLESYRVAKSDTPLIFTVNLPESMITFYQIFEKVLLNHGLNTNVEKLHQHIRDKRKTIEEWSQLVKDSGFIIKKIDEDKFYLNYMDGTTLFNHFFIKIAFLDSWEQIVAKRDMRKIFAELEQMLNQYASQQGSLNLIIPFACFNCVRI